MNFLQELYEKQKNLADALEENPGIRKKLVEDLYTDRVHFIYELLQNAEDAGATEASFELLNDRLIFRHNGSPFSDDDVKSIINFEEGNKRDQEDKIGRFGIGFKSVFAYSETPYIWSPTYSFKIKKLVLPVEINSIPNLNCQTQFEFPFNNPKKKKDIAYEEIRKGLNDLSEETTLFLNNIDSISWSIKDVRGEVLKIKHSDNHIEVLKQIGGETTESCHFLMFLTLLQGQEKRNVAVAYKLDFQPGIENFKSNNPLMNQMRIAPASPGRVAVFFPAEKETSNLRFHLQAPFVPELSRASIKDTPKNHPLFEQLAKLTVSSLYKIRDLGLLTREFLAVLPNPTDQIPARYQTIHEAIVKEMKKNPLTPVHSDNNHASAHSMLQANAVFKNLFTSEDLVYLHGKEKQHWAVSATQRNNNVDRFLQQLEIEYWDMNDLIHNLRWPNFSRLKNLDIQKFQKFMSGKSDEWHQEFYSTLYELKNKNLPLLKDLPLVRLSNGKYGVGKNSFFPDTIAGTSITLPRVESKVYTFGKNNKTQENAKNFLIEAGVREVGEKEEVEAILKERYATENIRPDVETYKTDLKRFIELVEFNSDSASLFKSYYIVKSQNYGWKKPNDVFIDSPILKTDLGIYFSAVGNYEEYKPLSEVYHKCGIKPQKLADFFSKIGVQTNLKISETNCESNPEWKYLSEVPGNTITYTRIDRDFTIKGLNAVLKNQCIELSRLIWLTMTELKGKNDHHKATYQKNKTSGSRQVDSQLIQILQHTKWIPQEGSNTFVTPAEASQDLLPSGFIFDSGWEWVKAIKFGQNNDTTVEQRNKLAIAKKIGFENLDSLNEAQEFVEVPKEEREAFWNNRERKAELPEQESTNTKRRAQRVEQMATDALDKKSEVKERTVAIGLRGIKEEAREYLVDQYTNSSEEMICQVCQKPLPFKLNDTNYYFECVEFLESFRKLHSQNYLALCPNHAAMFKHVNGSRDQLKNIVSKASGNTIEIILAEKPTIMYFTKNHLNDLKEIIRVEDILEENDNK